MKAEKGTYEELVDRYYQAVYWYIRRIVADHDNAQDILQETFIKAYRHFWQLRSTQSARPWLYRIATNEINRWFRKHAHGTEDLTESLAASLEDSPYVDYARVEAVALQRGLMQLSPLQRKVFTLKYFDDLDYEEIAFITGSSIGSLKVSYHQAKKIISQYVQD